MAGVLVGSVSVEAACTVRKVGKGVVTPVAVGRVSEDVVIADEQDQIDQVRRDSGVSAPLSPRGVDVATIVTVCTGVSGLATIARTA